MLFCRSPRRQQGMREVWQRETERERERELPFHRVTHTDSHSTHPPRKIPDMAWDMKVLTLSAFSCHAVLVSYQLTASLFLVLTTKKKYGETVINSISIHNVWLSSLLRRPLDHWLWNRFELIISLDFNEALIQFPSYCVGYHGTLDVFFVLVLKPKTTSI